MACAAHRRRGRCRRDGRSKSALEPAPRHALGVQEIADVRAAHEDGAGAGGAALVGAAIVEIGIGVADIRAIDDVAVAEQGLRGAVRLARNEVERARRRGAEGRAEGVVVEREMLRQVPQRRHRVAVVVAHHGLAAGPAAFAALPGRLHEHVGEAHVHSLLLVRVVVVLVAAVGLAAVEAEWGELVWIGRKQPVIEAVDGRRAGGGFEARLARRVGGVRVGREIVIERHVLLEDDDDVLDRRGRRHGGRPCGGARPAGERARGKQRQRMLAPRPVLGVHGLPLLVVERAWVQRAPQS